MKFNKIGKRAAVVLATAVIASTGLVTPASAAPYSSASKTPSDSRPTQVNQDTFNVTAGANTAIACIQVLYSLNGDGTGTIPGFSSTAATVGTTASDSPFTGTRSVNVATNGLVRITNASAIAPGTSYSFRIGNITNGSASAAARYATVRSFTNNDCSTGEVHSVVIGFVYTDGTTVSVTVDPTMTFAITPRATQCSLQSAGGYVAPASATSVDLGRITASTVGSGAHDLAVTTNAANGAVVKLRGTNLSGTPGTPFVTTDGLAPTAGTARYNFTNSDTDFTNGAWKAIPATDVNVASSTAGNLTGECVGFSASAASTTPSGAYTSNIIYTAVPQY